MHTHLVPCSSPGQVLLSTPFTVGGLCKHPCAALTLLPSVNSRGDNFDSIFKRHLSSPQDSDCSSEMRGCISPLKAAEFSLQGDTYLAEATAVLEGANILKA